MREHPGRPPRPVPRSTPQRRQTPQPEVPLCTLRPRMVFSSVTFLFFSCRPSSAAYYLVPRRGRNALLLLASLLFYTWGAGAIVFVAGRLDRGELRARARRSSGADAGRSRGAPGSPLAVGVVVNVGLLGWFKYANFGVATLERVLGALGAAALPWAAILLPIGISFYTFQALSYLDRRLPRQGPPPAHPVDFALYIAFFPQLVAGPIVRFHEIRDQLVERRETRRRVRGRRLPVRSSAWQEDADRRHARAGRRRRVRDAGRRALDTAPRVDRRRRVHDPALLRLLRLLGHGPRARADVRVSGCRELRPAVRLALDHRVLAALAHVAVALVPRLPLHPARRQPRVARASRRTATW